MFCSGILLSQAEPARAPVGSNAAESSPLNISLSPFSPYIEIRNGRKTVNFDLIVQNRSAITYQLVCIRLKIYDRNGRLEIEKELNENGNPPALEVIGPRLLVPGGILDIYQPFYSFEPEIDLHRMQFELLFMRQGDPLPPVIFTSDASAIVEVLPRQYTPAGYCLPLHGLLVVHDGHDYYSHHRRYNLVKRFEADPNSAVSANLYAYDFMKVTPDGALFRGDPTSKANWLTYGLPIFAPASGIVVDSVSDVPENSFAANGDAQIPSSTEAIDPLGFGNHVTILHTDGRVSWLLHMQPGSVAVAPGEHVRAGQFLGKVGFSGDSLFPHLHFNVTEGSRYPSQGVPSYFKHFVRVVGSRNLVVSFGEVDTGDLVQTEGDCK
jgi:hypothetical protein